MDKIQNNNFKMFEGFRQLSLILLKLLLIAIYSFNNDANASNTTENLLVYVDYCNEYKYSYYNE